MMKTVFFRRFTRYAVLRAAVLGIMAIVSMAFPDFLKSGMVYVIAGYALLNGVLCAVDCIVQRKDDRTVVSIVAAVPLIAFGILSAVYFRYMVGVLPVFLGVLMMIEGAIYFTAALFSPRLKPLLIFLAVLIVTGGIVANIFAFGFGGLLTLSRIFGTIAALSCLYEVTVVLAGRNKTEDD